VERVRVETFDIVGLTLRGETSLRRATSTVIEPNVDVITVVMARGRSIATEDDGYVWLTALNDIACGNSGAE
jgi:hypothetical protein